MTFLKMGSQRSLQDIIIKDLRQKQARGETPESFVSRELIADQLETRSAFVILDWIVGFVAAQNLTVQMREDGVIFEGVPTEASQA